ncbi:hypothetical protein KA005_56210 [bacterium]|nr:hypothetical protein [bacterium]
MSPESGKQDFNSWIDGVWQTTLDCLGEIAYREGSKIEGVREAIDERKVVEGKNLLWKVFPFLAIGIVGIWAVSKG